MRQFNPDLAIIVLVAPLLALAACGGSAKSGAPATAAGGTSGPAVNAAAPSANSPACRYATAFSKSLLDLTLSVPPDSVDLASASSAAELKRYIDAETQGTGVIVTSLKKLTPPNDFKALNTDLIGIYSSLNQQLLAAQQALAAGDNQKANDLLNAANTSLTTGAAVGDLATKYPVQSAQLDACPSS